VKKEKKLAIQEAKSVPLKGLESLLQEIHHHPQNMSRLARR
jgi:hypothetical protein